MKTLLEKAPFLFDNILYDKSNDINGTFNPSFLCITQARYNKEVEDLDTYQGQASTSIHEKIHWIQYVGTSWGRITLLMKFIQSQILIDSSTRLGFPKVHEMFSKMNINSDYSIDLGELELTDLNYYGLLKTLISHQVVFHLCSHGEIEYDSIKNLDKKFSKAITDSHYYTNIYFPLEDLNYQELKNTYEKKFSEIKSHYSMEGMLSTLDLLEGQARASEFLHFLQRSAFDKKYYDNTIDRYFVDQSYWKAFSSYMFLIQEEIDWFQPERLMNNLCKFCITVDIALNPKTFLDSTSQDFLMQDIEDFFPSRRFLNCAIAAKVFKGEFNYKNEQHHIEFCDFICEFNHYLSPTEISKNFHNKYASKIISFKEKWEGKDFKIARIPMIHYYFYVFSKYAEIRQKFPIYLQNLGITGHFSEKYLEIKFSKEYKFFDCPFYCYDEQKIIYNAEIEVEKFFWLLGEVLKPEVLKCALLKQYDLTNYFPFTIPKALIEALENLSKSVFGINMKIKKNTTPNMG